MDLHWKTIDGLKARKAVILQRMLAFNRRHLHWEPTPEETKLFEADKTAVAAINKALERAYEARPLTRAEIQAQLASILREEQEAMCRSQSRRR